MHSLERSLPQFNECVCVCSVLNAPSDVLFEIWLMQSGDGLYYYLAGNKDQDSVDCWRESFTQLDVLNLTKKNEFLPKYFWFSKK